MSGIEELRQRVMDAEARFGLNDAQRAKDSERLIFLMNAVEGRIREQQDEIAQQAEEIEKLKVAGACNGEENEQLRDMLHALLQAIESGGRDGLAETMQELDRKASALVDLAPVEPVAESADDEAIELTDEPPAEAAIAVGPVSIAPLDEAEDAPGIEHAAIAEPAPEEIVEPVAEEAAEPVAEEIAGPAAEAEVPAAAEVEEPAAEETQEPAAEAETPAAEEIEEPVPEENEEPAAEAPVETAPAAAPETASEAAPQTTAETSDEAPSNSLDEIMERVSKLVEETEAAIAYSAPCGPEAASEAAAETPALAVAEDLVDEAAEIPAQQATGTDP